MTDSALADKAPGMPSAPSTAKERVDDTARKTQKTRLRLIISIPVLMVVPVLLTGVIQYRVLINSANPTQANSDVLTSLLISTLVLVLYAAFWGVVLGFYITNPIQKIIRNLNDVARGDLYRAVDIQTQDELSELGRSFNKMVRSLSETIEERNNLILECYTGGLITLDQEGRVLAINKSAEQILEVRGYQIMSHVFADFFAERKGLGSLLEIARQGLEEGWTVQSVETSICREDGRMFPLIVTTSLLRGDNAEVRGLGINFRDLTKYKQFHDRLNRTDRLATAGTLAMGVAHEIRNPLAAIRAMAQLLQADQDPNDPGRQYTDVIVSESLRLDQVVSELLDYAQPDEAVRESESLSALLLRAVELLRIRLEDQGDDAPTIVQRIEELPAQPYYADKLVQAMLNILDNSATLVPEEGGEIQVSTRLATRSTRGVEEQVHIAEIANNGPPIPAEDIKHVFEPFYTNRPGGSGLGLSITYQIVTFNGGDIEVQSDDSRTAFIITFPENREGAMAPV